MWPSAIPISGSSAPGNGDRASGALYGRPAPGLVEIPAGAEQVSPLVPGSKDLADLKAGEADAAFVLAPPGTLERDFVIAQALRVVRAGGELTVFAPKDKGGSRLRKALESFGCEVFEDARRHHRFCQMERPQTVQRLDAVLALKVLAGAGVSELTLVELDRRAVRAAEHNLDDPRVKVVWGDVRQMDGQLSGLDFVVMNPPFHDGGQEDRALGQAFIRAAASLLRKGGACWLTANRHLPYEAVLQENFRRVDLRAEDGGYKIYEAQA